VIPNQEDGAPQANERQHSYSRYANRTRSSYDENPEDGYLQEDIYNNYDNVTRSSGYYYSEEEDENQEDEFLQANGNYYFENDGNQEDGATSYDNLTRSSYGYNYSEGDGNQEVGSLQAYEVQPSSSRYANRARNSYGYNSEDDENPEDGYLQANEMHLSSTSYDNVTRSSYGYYSADDENQEDSNLPATEVQPSSSTSSENVTWDTRERGLESLAMVDQLILKQELELMEVAIGVEEANKYTVFDSSGNVMFTVQEDGTNCVYRCCCGGCRSFNVMIMDTQGQPIIQLVSPNTCNWCCLRSIEVQSPPGTAIGFAQQQFTWFYPKIKIQKENGKTFIIANGPLRAYGKCCTGDAEFVLTDNTGEEVGKISKKWGGATTEIFTDADTFKISFPEDLDTTSKAILLGTAIFVDFVFYEN